MRGSLLRTARLPVGAEPARSRPVESGGGDAGASHVGADTGLVGRDLEYAEQEMARRFVPESVTRCGHGQERAHEGATRNGEQMSSFPPIADYGFISDCENSCLIAPDGSIEWMCLPRPDAPSIFGALLDRTAGSFRLGPSNTHVPAPAKVPPGDDGHGDHVAHPQRMAPGPGLPFDRTGAAGRGGAHNIGALRATRRRSATWSASQPASGEESRSSRIAYRCSTTGPPW